MWKFVFCLAVFQVILAQQTKEIRKFQYKKDLCVNMMLFEIIITNKFKYIHIY